MRRLTFRQVEVAKPVTLTTGYSPVVFVCVSSPTPNRFLRANLRRNRLLYAVLAHHGALERGSPVVPKTLEALALHHADWLDGSVPGFIDAVESEPVSEAGWTGFARMFRPQLYRASVKPPEDEEEIPF